MCSDKNYANPRIYTANAQFEQELARDLSVYFDFTHSKGVHLTRFLNYGTTGLFPTLGDVFVASAVGKSLYNGFTVGVRKRMSKRYQFELNYVLVERSRTTIRTSAIRSRIVRSISTILALTMRFRIETSGTSSTSFHLLKWAGVWKATSAFRRAARNPSLPATRTATNRNTLRKDNKYFSFDWRIQRPFKFGERFALIPIVEMFNTFNNANNINPLSTPGLFNFDGFLRQGVGDPRQLQLAVKLTF